MLVVEVFGKIKFYGPIRVNHSFRQYLNFLERSHSNFSLKVQVLIWYLWIVSVLTNYSFLLASRILFFLVFT